MSVMFANLDEMLRHRGVFRRSDGSFAEDSYDYGVWWKDRRGGVYRLTWIGSRMREDPEKAGELYFVRLSGPIVGTVALSEIRERDSLVAADFVSAGAGGRAVELLCTIPPATNGEAQDANVERILDGWADVCGEQGSIGWVRRRVVAAVAAGEAREASVIRVG